MRHSANTPVNDQPLLLQTGSGNLKQQGHWTVPRTIVANCGMGTLTIDFTQAYCPHHEVTLNATVGAGNIVITVPHGWHVVLVEAVSRMGHISNKATDPPDPTLPVLKLHGNVGLGHIKIRYSRR
jgi:hypothetical protein